MASGLTLGNMIRKRMGCLLCFSLLSILSYFTAFLYFFVLTGCTVCYYERITAEEIQHYLPIHPVLFQV